MSKNNNFYYFVRIKPCTTFDNSLFFAAKVLSEEKLKYVKTEKRIITLLNCKSIIFIAPKGIENVDFHLINTFSSVKLSFDQTGTPNHGIKVSALKIYYDCIVITLKTKNTLRNVTDLVDRNRVDWDYEIKVLIICSDKCKTRQLLTDLDSSETFDSNLMNAMVVDSKSRIIIKICASSKKVYKINSLGKVGKEFLKERCKVDLHGHVIPILLKQSPPVTEFKEPSQAEKTEIGSIEELKGVVTSTIREMMWRFNFKIDIVSSKKFHDLIQYVQKKESVFHDPSKVADGTVKISGNPQPTASIILHDNISLSHPIYREKSVILIDKNLFSFDLSIYKIFHPTVWWFLILTILAVIGTWVIIRKVIGFKEVEYGNMIFSVTYMTLGGNYHR